MRELEHRVRNMLSLVMSLMDRARESTQSSEQFALSVRGRIQSMANAQTLLSQSRWQGVSLADLIRTELEPYATGTNTSLDGPVVHLTPNAAHGVAMVMHELTSNAAKYGALSKQGGQVSVWWNVTDERSPAATLSIKWVEAGGPKVEVPARQGHGSAVIRDLLSYELDGNVDLVFAPEGVRCTIDLPAKSRIEGLG
jgi:two-component system, chemotaxis family, CheB/CheR fusion protein